LKIYKCDLSDGMNNDGIRAAEASAKAVRSGKLIVYPTDTVYGVGADIYDESAVKSLYQAKKRPFDMALSVAVADIAQMENVAVLNETAEKLIDAFMPGPLTIIIQKQPDVPDIVTAGSQKVGIRIPNHPMAMEIAKRAGPIVATSANTHFHPDAVNIDMAVDAFGESVSVYVDCGASPLGKPSTIVWIKDKDIEIVRQGLITEQMINEVLNC
jgi:L-threonylcarbamoyladenylate synthase